MKRPAVGGRGSTGATTKLGSARSSNRHALPSRWCHQPRGSGPACHVCRHRHRHRWHHSRRPSWRKSNSPGKWSTSTSNKYCTRRTRQNRMWGNIEKVDKLREWAHRRIQQLRQLPDPQQEEGQQAPPMRLGRQPQTRGKKRKAACVWGRQLQRVARKGRPGPGRGRGRGPPPGRASRKDHTTSGWQSS